MNDQKSAAMIRTKLQLQDEFNNANPRALIKIAVIGTKPHALGAVLFSLTSGCPTKLVYDHPIRKRGRTNETEQLLVYYVSAILTDGILRGPERHQGRRRRRLQNA